MKSNASELRRFIKYCVVGVMNTLITLGSIFICKSLLGVDPYVSNAIGYALGLLNSFLWNKNWVFRSKGKYTPEAIKFLLGFALCYAVQFSAVWIITNSSFGSITYDIGFFVISGYGIATLVGNVLYTVCNFIYNRVFTFRK